MIRFLQDSVLFRIWFIQYTCIPFYSEFGLDSFHCIVYIMRKRYMNVKRSVKSTLRM